jgi:hypothetical protein
MYGRNEPRELCRDSLNGRRYYTLSECARKLNVDKLVLEVFEANDFITSHHKSMTKGVKYYDIDDIRAVLKKLRDE